MPRTTVYRMAATLDSGLEIELYHRSQLAVVAGGARPGWLAIPSPRWDEKYAGLIPQAEEMGLQCHHFEGLDELTPWGERRYSGYLFYNPKAVKPADMAHLREHGWGKKSSNAAIGRVLGYDCPGIDTIPHHTQVRFHIILTRVGKKKVKTALTSLFWYNISELNAETAFNAANLAQKIRHALRDDPELQGRAGSLGRWRPQVFTSFE